MDHRQEISVFSPKENATWNQRSFVAFVRAQSLLSVV